MDGGASKSIGEEGSEAIKISGPARLLIVGQTDPENDKKIRLITGDKEVDLLNKPSSTDIAVKNIITGDLAEVSPDLMTEGMGVYIGCLRMANYGAAASGNPVLMEKVYRVNESVVTFLDLGFQMTTNVKTTCNKTVELMSIALEFFLEGHTEEADSLMNEVGEKVKLMTDTIKAVKDGAEQAAQIVERLRQEAIDEFKDSEDSRVTQKVAADCQEGIRKIIAYVKKQDALWNTLGQQYSNFGESQARSGKTFKMVKKSDAAKRQLYVALCGFVALEEVCKGNLVEMRKLRERFYEQLVEHPDQLTARETLPLIMEDPNYVPSGADRGRLYLDALKEEKAAEAAKLELARKMHEDSLRLAQGTLKLKTTTEDNRHEECRWDEERKRRQEKKRCTIQ